MTKELSPETVEYIIRHYSHLLPVKEKSLLSKFRSSLQRGADPDLFQQLTFGPHRYETKVAEQILEDHKDQIVFNNCPKCGALARTPVAKQCWKCNFHW